MLLTQNSTDDANRLQLMQMSAKLVLPRWLQLLHLTLSPWPPAIAFATKTTQPQRPAFLKAHKAPGQFGCRNCAAIQVALNDSEESANQARNLGAKLDALRQQLAAVQQSKAATEVSVAFCVATYTLEFIFDTGVFFLGCVLACTRCAQHLMHCVGRQPLQIVNIN